MLNIDKSRSYATEASLEMAIERLLHTNGLKFLTVCNRQGRFTAVFLLKWNSISALNIAQAGFIVVV